MRIQHLKKAAIAVTVHKKNVRGRKRRKTKRKRRKSANPLTEALIPNKLVYKEAD